MKEVTAAEDYAERHARHEREALNRAMLMGMLSKQEQKLDDMIGAYRRYAADFGLPDMPDDALRAAANVMLAGLEGRGPWRRHVIKHT